jgi:peptidoglycan/xylan/chitin deacetylase (PgdA/CDA1 family)
MRLTSIPVGMYHHVNQNAGDRLTVSIDNFYRQMEWLHREGYETLDAENFLAVLRGERPPAARSFVITFDDAWLDVYVHAFPVLKKFGHKFIVFVVSDWTDAASKSPLPAAGPSEFPTHKAAEKLVVGERAREVICSWQHLREMQASGLGSIENHTAAHLKAATLADEALRESLVRCQSAIKENLGRNSRQVCWPYGSHTAANLAVARQLGLTTSYLVRRGVNLVGGRTFAVKRFTVENRDEVWLEKQLRIFRNPIRGFLHARLKSDRWFRKPIGGIP